MAAVRGLGGARRPPHLAAPRGRAALVQASKGFGQPSSQPKKDDDAAPAVKGASPTRERRVKSKGKQSMRGMSSGRPLPQPQQQRGAAPAPGAPGGDDGPAPVVDQLEFDQRLKALEADARQQREQRRREREAAAGVLGAPLGSGDGVIDYARPPPLAQTVFGGGGGGGGGGDAGSPGAAGSGQLGLAAAALALVAVFVVANAGSDLAYSGGGGRPAAGAARPAAELPPAARAEVEAQLKAFDARLAADTGDLEALESAAVLRTRLGEYAAAAAQLDALAAAKPGDADVWRVLGEARAAAGEPKAAVAAFEKGWEASGRASLEVLEGLTSALVADGRGDEAVELAKAAAAAGGPLGGGVDPALLLARVLQAAGRPEQALAAASAAVGGAPDDFRPVLARALLLRQQGREGEAARELQKARFLAPPGAARAKITALITDS